VKKGSIEEKGTTLRYEKEKKGKRSNSFSGRGTVSILGKSLDESFTYHEIKLIQDKGGLPLKFRIKDSPAPEKVGECREGDTNKSLDYSYQTYIETRGGDSKLKPGRRFPIGGARGA